MTPSFDRAQKNIIRERLLEAASPARCLITLPSKDILCVMNMIGKGLINHETKQYWIETDRDNIESMQRHAASLDLEPTIVAADVRHWTPPENFDFLNLDLMEGFGPAVGEWFELRARDKIENGATLCLTLTESSRNKMPHEFQKWFLDKCRTDPRFLSIIQTSFHIEAQQNDAIISALMLLACALNNFTFQVPYFEPYADGMPMIAIRVIVRRRTSAPVLPLFTDLLREWDPTYTPVTFTREGGVQKPREPTVPLPEGVVLPEPEAVSTPRPVTPKPVLPEGEALTDREIDYKRRWAKARGTMARNEREEVFTKLQDAITAAPRNEVTIAVLLQRAAELTERIGLHDADERHYTRPYRNAQRDLTLA